MKEIIKLAKDVQKKFQGFYLAGGPSLMIKYNHRESIDLDFFKEKSFSFNKLIPKIQTNFKTDSWQRGNDNIDFFIKGIKVSFVLFPFKNIKKVQTIKNIAMASDLDIFLNKIYASERRIEPKDPYDAAYLYKINKWDKKKLNHHSKKSSKVRVMKYFLALYSISKIMAPWKNG